MNLIHLDWNTREGKVGEIPGWGWGSHQCHAGGLAIFPTGTLGTTVTELIAPLQIKISLYFIFFKNNVCTLLRNNIRKNGAGQEYILQIN